MCLYFYQCGPIDHYWEYLPTFKQWMKMMMEDTMDEISWHADFNGKENPLNVPKIINDQANLLDMALKIAIHPHFKLGWDGDFTREPRLFFIPSEEHVQFYTGFIWKQSNNGTVFVASHIPLPDKWMSNVYETQKVELEEAEKFFLQEYENWKKRVREAYKNYQKMGPEKREAKIREKHEEIHKNKLEEPKCVACKCQECVPKIKTRWQLEFEYFDGDIPYES